MNLLAALYAGSYSAFDKERLPMSQDYLKRYTDIPALAYLLSERKITLLDPRSWDDQNDSYYLSVYKRKKSLKTVLALCFTQAPETYHHWKVFAGNNSGVCIYFNRAELREALKKKKGVRIRQVEYRTRSQNRLTRPSVKLLPFLKRSAFGDEDEIRVTYESKTQRLPTLDIAIPLSCIEKVVLSPWAHSNMENPIRKMLKSIDGCHNIGFYRSSLISNDEWKSMGDDATI